MLPSVAMPVPGRCNRAAGPNVNLLARSRRGRCFTASTPAIRPFGVSSKQTKVNQEVLASQVHRGHAERKATVITVHFMKVYDFNEVLM
jgi:hypothetical protein